MNIEVSVIVPVYNVACYLEKCLNSILKQRNRNFELLLIDDGSQDGSGAICDKFAILDKRVRVIHKENGGVSSARNVGLVNAVGEWFAFVDSDDTVDQDYLTIPQNMKDSDIIEKGYITTGETIISRHQVDKNETFDFEDREIVYKRYFRKCQFALWNRLYSRKIVNNVKFDERLRIGEDLIFFLTMLHKVRKYSFCSVGCYEYSIREGSAMSLSKTDNKQRVQRIFQMINILNSVPECVNMHYLKSAILFKFNLFILFKLKKFMSFEDRKRFSELKKTVCLKDLKYLSFKDKALYVLFRLSY